MLDFQKRMQRVWSSPPVVCKWTPAKRWLLVDSVIGIFPQDGDPVSWSMEMMMKLVTLLIDGIFCREKVAEVHPLLLTKYSVNDVHDQPLIVSCWRGLEWRQVVKWGSERVENRMCLMSGSARWECSLMISSPEDISGGLAVSPSTSWQLCWAVERASPT